MKKSVDIYQENGKWYGRIFNTIYGPFNSYAEAEQHLHWQGEFQS